MIGTTLYKAKVKDGKIIIESNTIVTLGRKLYYFDENCICGCYKKDVGVVCFLTQKEAMNYLIEKIRHSIKMGDRYITQERLRLAEALNFKVE